MGGKNKIKGLTKGTYWANLESWQYILIFNVGDSNSTLKELKEGTKRSDVWGGSWWKVVALTSDDEKRSPFFGVSPWFQFYICGAISRTSLGFALSPPLEECLWYVIFVWKPKEACFLLRFALLFMFWSSFWTSDFAPSNKTGWIVLTEWSCNFSQLLRGVGGEIVKVCSGFCGFSVE